jgi:hypothetical protein
MSNLHKLPTKNICPISLHKIVLHFAYCSKTTPFHHSIHPCQSLSVSKCRRLLVRRASPSEPAALWERISSRGSACTGLGQLRPDADRAEASSELASSHAIIFPFSYSLAGRRAGATYFIDAFVYAFETSRSLVLRKGRFVGLRNSTLVLLCILVSLPSFFSVFLLNSMLSASHPIE